MSLRPEEYWQTIQPAGTYETAPADGYRDLFPASFPDGRQIALPIRPRPGGAEALASLIINQASFDVLDAFAAELAKLLRPFAPHIVVGLPTLGLTLATETSRRLGHTRMVPLGTSRKFWYREDLSVPLSSVTSPGQEKRLYADPRMLPLLAGRRVVLIDDVISTGTSIAAGLEVLGLAGVTPVAIVVAMAQTERWRERLRAIRPECAETVVSVISTPLLVPAPPDGWRPG